MNRARAIMEGVTGAAVHHGNTVEVFRNGDEIFPAMLQSIQDAEHTIDLLTYVYWTGEIAQKIARTLAERAGDGLRVRVILDAAGSFSMDHALIEAMKEGGCQVEIFRTADDRPTRLHHRTHRKLLICDERSAMTGGVGIAEEWEGDARSPDEWRDTHFRVTGPVVRPMEAAFIEHWVECGHPSYAQDDAFPEIEPVGDTDVLVLRGSSGPFWHTVGLGMDALLRGVRETLNLTTAYFAPGDRMLGLLCDAAKRGVAVRLLLPGTHLDKRVVHLASSDEYETLLECGVQIFHYEQTMLHTKSLTVDGHISLVGSANIDERSMRHNEEIAVAIFDEDVTAVLDGHFENDLTKSEEIDLEGWKDRGLLKRIAERLVNPIEDLL